MGIQIQGATNWALPLNTAGGRVLTYGGGRLPENLAFAVDIQTFSLQPKKSDPTKPIAKFTYVVSEPGFEGVERAGYAALPEPINAGDSDEAKRSKQFVHNNWITILASLGYNDQQINAIAAQGLNAGTIANAPGGGKAYIFVTYEDQEKVDPITKQVITNPATGQAVTQESENRNFCSRENYLKYAASTAEQRKKGQQQGAVNPTFAPPAPTPLGMAPPLPAGAPPMPGQVAPGYPTAPPGYPAAPPQFTPPGAYPNGVGGAPAAPPSMMMGVLGQPPRTP